MFKTTVIAGQYKNRSIHLPKLPTTRASKNRLRKSFFDTMQYEIIDSVFIEVFAGSGSMGIEALSRGAKKAYFIEQDKQSFAVLTSNINDLAITNAHTILGDSFVELPHLLTTFSPLELPIILYFDPPFAIRKGQEHIYTILIDLIDSLPKQPMVRQKIIIEHQTSFMIPQNIAYHTLSKQTRFGKTTLSYFIPYGTSL